MSGARIGLILVACLALPGCLASRQRPDVLAELARALESDAVVVRGEGLPLDEAAAPADALGQAAALRLALRASPALQAALARVRLAEAEADLARALPNPVLDVLLRVPAGGGRVEIDAGIATPLLELLTRPRRASAAEDRLAEAAAEALSVALDLVLEVRELYLAAQAADEGVVLVDARRASVAGLVEVARARQAAGEGTRLDVLALETQVLVLELVRIEREGLRRQARLALARVLGEPSSEPGWELEPLVAPTGEPPSEEQALARALARRPELQARRWALAALATELGLSRSEAFAGTALGLGYERDEGTSLGPALSIPLPLFQSGAARQRRAEARLVAAQSELAGRERAVVEEVRRAAAALATARERLALLEERLVPLERERRDQLGAAYREGRIDVTSLLLAEQSLHEALGRSRELTGEVALAVARFERAAVGSGTP